MYKICRTEESEQRGRLMESVLLGFMQNRPFKDISVSEICREAKVPRKSFYRYFDSKEDVLYALLDHSAQSVKYSCATLEEFREQLEKMFTFYYENPFLAEAMQQQGMAWLAICHTAKWNDREEFDAEKFPQKRKEIQRDIYNLYHSAGLFSLILWCHEAGWPKTPKEMADLVAGVMSPVRIQEDLSRAK